MEVMETFRAKQSERDILRYLNLRTASPNDDLDLGAFLLRVFGDAYYRFEPRFSMTPERIQELLNTSEKRKQGLTKILELGKTIVATYTLLPPESPLSDTWHEDASYFCSFAIDPQIQRLDIGQLLMLDAHYEALRQESSRLTLHVVKGLGRLQRFYEKLGFSEDPQGNAFKSGFDLVGYVMPLSYEHTSDMLKAI